MGEIYKQLSVDTAHQKLKSGWCLATGKVIL